MAFPDIWGEGTALVAITASGGSDIDFSAVVNSIDIDMGDKDFDSIPTIRGGRVKKQTPEADTTVTFEGYPLDLDTTSTDVLQRFFTTRANWDTSGILSVTNAILKRDNFRVVITWTENTTVSSATALVPTGSEALRFVVIKCQLVSVKPSFTDNELKFTFKFKCAPFQKDGTANLTWKSSDGTATLTAESSYT